MPLTATEAATIAKRHGLSLTDAAGLLSLADNADEADAIAKRFAEPDTQEASRQLVRDLFGTSERDETPPPPKLRAVEGGNPSPVDKTDADLRRFTANLFDRDPA